MSTIHRLLARLLPAALMAGGVTLVAAGLLSYTAPPVVGEHALPSPSPAATPRVTPEPSATAEPARTPGPSATATAAAPSPTPTPAVATRIRIPAYRIDLAILPGDFDPPGNDGYPLCDVAQYLVQYRQPSEEGTTYIFAHARTGMFLPLLQESERRNGARMLGTLVQVYTEDLKVYLYEIFQVKRHSTDFEIADDLEPGEQRLILQTSEGPAGTIPKLQVAARLLSVQPATRAEAIKEANWTSCR